MPTIYDLMTIEPFLARTDGADLVDVNDDPIFRNNLLLRLASDPFGEGIPWTRILEFGVQQLTVIYGTDPRLRRPREDRPVSSAWRRHLPLRRRLGPRPRRRRGLVPGPYG